MFINQSSDLLEKTKKRCEEDKRFKLILIGGIIVVLALIGLFIYNTFFSIDVTCSINEDNIYADIKAKFDGDELVYYETSVKMDISDYTDDMIEYVEESLYEEKSEMEDVGYEVSVSVSDNTIIMVVKADKDDTDYDYYGYFDVDSESDFIEELESDGFTCSK